MEAFLHLDNQSQSENTYETIDLRINEDLT